MLSFAQFEREVTSERIRDKISAVAPHHRSPTSAIEPAGQDLAAPLAPEINGQYRSNGGAETKSR